MHGAPVSSAVRACEYSEVSPYVDISCVVRIDCDCIMGGIYRRRDVPPGRRSGGDIFANINMATDRIALAGRRKRMCRNSCQIWQMRWIERCCIPSLGYSYSTNIDPR